MKIAIIGAGYVGLTTGVCLANLGHQVTVHDANRERLDALLAGHLPIYEPGLAEAFDQARCNGSFRISLSVDQCVPDAAAVFLAVGTPARQDGSVDTRQLQAAARQIAPHLKSGAVVVVKSTVSVGTGKVLRRHIAQQRGSMDFAIGSNPEFLREGSALNDFMCPDRIVVGADDDEALEVLTEIYQSLVAQGVPLLETSIENAEMIKHAANAFLALKIGFINEVADFCELVGADVTAIARGIGLDGRIGSAFLTAGPGFGGSCFPKDTRAFAAAGRQAGAPQALVETLIQRNERRQVDLAERVCRELKDRSPVVAMLGLSFKAQTDDIRESPAITIGRILLDHGIRLRVHDPRAMANASLVLDEIECCRTPYEAARGADATVVITEWPDYAALDLTRLRRQMRGRHLFDFRNLIDPLAAARSSLTYHGVGRGSMLPQTAIVPSTLPTRLSDEVAMAKAART